MVDPTKCWIVVRDLGDKFVDRILLPEMLDVSKGIASSFPADKIIQDRVSVKAKIEDALRLRLAKHPFIVRAVSITNIQFSKEYEKAIEEKQVADQHVKKALYTKQQAEIDAERVLVTATGEAKSFKVKQEALRQSPEVIQMMAIEKWDGNLPTVMGGGAVPFLNIPMPSQEKR
jgi:regulator of protease activity HflC (stomatin/prohibitin superfamily)